MNWSKGNFNRFPLIFPMKVEYPKFHVNVDWVAAQNIATPNIESIIKEQLNKQAEQINNAKKYIV